MLGDTEALLGMLESAVSRAKQSIIDEAIRMEQLITGAIRQPTSTVRKGGEGVEPVARRNVPLRKTRARVRFEAASDDEEDDDDDDEDYVVGRE